MHDLLAKRAGSDHPSVTYINLQLLSKSRLFTEFDGQRTPIRFNSVCEAPFGCFTSYFDVLDVNEASFVSSNSRWEGCLKEHSNNTKKSWWMS